MSPIKLFFIIIIHWPFLSAAEQMPALNFSIYCGLERTLSNFLLLVSSLHLVNGLPVLFCSLSISTPILFSLLSAVRPPVQPPPLRCCYTFNDVGNFYRLFYYRVWYSQNRCFYCFIESFARVKVSVP